MEGFNWEPTFEAMDRAAERKHDFVECKPMPHLCNLCGRLRDAPPHQAEIVCREAV